MGRYRDLDGEGTGQVVFVPQTAPGDRIACHILKVDKRCAYGKVQELVSQSPDRLAGEPDCPVFGKCGGCAWRHVNYAAELRYKQQAVVDALARIGGVTVPVRPIVGAQEPDRYRNKAQYPVAPGKHRPLFGFYAPHSHRVVEQRDCLLQPACFAAALGAVGRWMKKYNVPAYKETDRTGLVRHVYIRQGAVTGECQVCLVCTSGKLPEPGALVEGLRDAVPGLVSLMVNRNPEDTNVVLGETSFVLWGKDHIVDELCGRRFRLSPRAFYQVNHDQAERLYGLAGEVAALTGSETLLDLYCGTGTIGLTMADRLKTLIGVETVAEAIENARANAAENGIENARFLCADAGQAAKQLVREGLRPDVIVMDPPRKGCDETVLRAVGELAPARLVYVSCDPATLARDTARLLALGYRAEYAVPVDMFPRTGHVETVLRLTKTPA